MQQEIKGTVFIMGNDVNTDVIIPGKYLIYTDPAELAKYAFSVMGPEYTARLKKFDLIAAGDNFGCGSAREQGATAIKGLKIKAVIARSFARTFYRNAINSGLPIVECPAAVDAVKEGDRIGIDFAAGKLSTPYGEFSFVPLPKSVFRILAAGGLAEYLKAEMRK